MPRKHSGAVRPTERQYLALRCQVPEWYWRASVRLSGALEEKLWYNGLNKSLAAMLSTSASSMLSQEHSLNNEYTAEVRARFWEKAQSDDECWEWNASRSAFGYGLISIDGKLKLAHRVAWEICYGESLSSDICVLHKCDNPPCVRPSHLFTGTRADNIRDMESKGRKQVATGEQVCGAKLTGAQILEIREAANVRGTPTRTLAAFYGVSASQVRRIVRREYWRHV